MKKLYRKNTVHPTPPMVSDQLAFLPAAILTITAALSQDEQEALAYLISCPSGNFSTNRRTTTTTTTSSSFSGGVDHPPSFKCYCFDCYMSYWARWDSSPNRQLIHQVIDAYEDGLQSKKEKRRRERKKTNKDSGSSAGESKKPEVILNMDESDKASPVEDSPNSIGGGGEDDCGGEGGAERGAVRRFASFLGERIWSVWT